MNLSQFKPFKQYSFYDDSIYNQIFENVTRRKLRPYCIPVCILFWDTLSPWSRFRMIDPVLHSLKTPSTITDLYIPKWAG
jgi:hypothetical protein